MREFWDTRYGESVYAYGTSPNAFFAEQLAALSPGRLLLPGEGEGRNAVWAAEHGWQVDAFDFSTAGRDKCQKLAAERGVVVRYDVASYADATHDLEAYDALALVFAHMHEQHRRAAHRRLVTALRPGGRLIIEAFTKDQLPRGTGGPRSLEMLYAPDELREDFAALDIQSFETREVTLHEGPFHEGLASVVRLVAVR